MSRENLSLAVEKCYKKACDLSAAAGGKAVNSAFFWIAALQDKDFKAILVKNPKVSLYNLKQLLLGVSDDPSAKADMVPLTNPSYGVQNNGIIAIYGSGDEDPLEQVLEEAGNNELFWVCYYLLEKLPGTKFEQALSWYASINLTGLEHCREQWSRDQKGEEGGADGDQFDPHNLLKLEGAIEENVFGQSHVVRPIAESLQVAYSGLREPNKPKGVFLFVGQTGVGKTEVAKQLAHVLGCKLLRFNMSEYGESHTVSSLIGSPPGYVNSDEGGALTEQVKEHPQSVVLFDEVEKAHPDVLKIFLQISDEGILKDRMGKEVDFSQTIVIFTSNAGAQDAARNAIGFNPSSDRSDVVDAALGQVFAPEMLNRIDRVLHFESLTHQAERKVVDKFLSDLQGRAREENGVTLEFHQDLPNWVVAQASDPKMGARPFRRFIEQKLTVALARYLLTNPSAGRTLMLYEQRGEILIRVMAPALTAHVQQ